MTLQEILDLVVIPAGPPIAATILMLLALRFVPQIMDRRAKDRARATAFSREVAVAMIWGIGLTSILIALPMHDATRGQIMGLIGILLSAAIALSSTTLLGNALAGAMIKSRGTMKVGDFIRIEDQFGRVTEIGLTHSEIQNEQRDLVSLPNLDIVSKPVEVIRSTGTLISASVSLGYDVPQTRIKLALREAAERCELEDPFVLVGELGDFSVVYTVYGLLRDTKRLLTATSNLRASMLDALHEARIEIVSPTFMNQRQLDPEVAVIPKRQWLPAPAPEDEVVPEELMFDKAIATETIEKLRSVHKDLGQRIEEVEAKLEGLAVESPEHAELERKRYRLAYKRDRLTQLIADKEAEVK